MKREDIIKLAREVCDKDKVDAWHNGFWTLTQEELERFAELVRDDERNACVQIIEEYRIPVGNSRSGELAYEWTYAALKEIRDDIRARK